MWVYRCPECPTTVALGVSLADPPRCRSCATADHRGQIMYAIPETSRERALLPLDGRPVARAAGGQDAMLVPAKVDKLHAAGFLLPETQHALDWMWRHKDTNGMASAFLKVGGRRCIDLVEFARLMRSKQA